MNQRIRIIAVGGLKEGCLIEASNYYISRLKLKYNISVIELPDEPAPDNLSAAGRQAVLVCEGKRVTSRLTSSNITASLAIDGKPANLSFFCGLMEKAAAENRCVDFVIGGSLGLADSVLRQSDYRISLSALTFPHRLARLLLLEVLNNI